MKTNRELSNTKSNKMVVATGQPRTNEGAEGDLCIRKLRDGIFLFAKYGNLWYKVNKLEVHNPKHSNQTVTNATTGPLSVVGQTIKGGSGNTGIGAGAKFFLDTIKSRLGIKGKNYIQSGTTASSLGRDSTNSDTSYMNLALDSKPLLILSGIKGSDNTPETLTFKSTLNHANGPIFNFVKDKGAAGANGDDIGTIEFTADDSTQVQTSFARILAEVSDATDGDEAGKLSLSVATSDGGTSAVRPGLVLTGDPSSMEVDASIGTGAASTTAVAGNITVVGTVDGVDIAARDAVLTATTTTANAALPLSGGTMTGNINLSNGDLTTSGGAHMDIASDGDINLSTGRDMNVNLARNLLIDVDGGAARLTDDSESSNVFTPAHDADITTKAYVDTHQRHSIQDRFYFDVETTSRTYFRDIDSTSYENKWDAYDSEDETSVGQTISIVATTACAGLIVPYDCKLKGVQWIGNNALNYDNVVYIQTWTGAAIPDNFSSTTSVTATLRDSITLTNYKRKYFNQTTALDVAMSEGQMIYPAFQYASGTAVAYSGSVVYLLERA